MIFKKGFIYGGTQTYLQRSNNHARVHAYKYEHPSPQILQVKNRMNGQLLSSAPWNLNKIWKLFKSIHIYLGSLLLLLGISFVTVFILWVYDTY